MMRNNQERVGDGEIGQGVNEVFDYLMTLGDIVISRPDRELLLQRHRFEGLNPGEQLAEMRSKIHRMLTDQKLVDAGFVLVFLEELQIEHVEQWGETEVVSCAMLRPSVLEETVYINTETGEPTEYIAELIRKSPLNTSVERKLTEELRG